MASERRSLVRRNADFRWFWGGQSISVLGTQVTAVALPLVAALTLGTGAGGIGLIATASFLPNALLPLFAGNWLDTRRRRSAMVGADVVRALALAVVPISYALDAVSIPLLVVVAFIVGSASVVFDIGGFAYVPSLVDEDDLLKANRAMQGSSTAAQVGGPGVAGVLVQLMGPAVAILVDSISYVASVFGLLAARRPEPMPEPVQVRLGIFEGLRQVVRNPFLRALTTHAAVYNASGQIFVVNIVVWMVKERHVPVGVYGVALSAAGAGAFLGTMMALRLAERLGYGRAFASSLVLSCGAPLVVALLPMHGVALGLGVGAVMVVSGTGLGSANVLSTTLRQVVTPRGSLARTNGGYRFLIFGVIPIGSALGGVIGQVLGSRWGVGIGTMGLTVSAFPMWTRRMRALRDPADAKQQVAGLDQVGQPVPPQPVLPQPVIPAPEPVAPLPGAATDVTAEAT
ncbi:MAG: MFS transporter [Frankiaceae bacterium]